MSLLGVFSIFENLKSGQKISSFKINVILFLLLVTIASTCDFLHELGYQLKSISSITRVLGVMTFVNLFYMVASHRLPRMVILFEAVLMLIYIILILNGFQFVTINNGNFNIEVTLANKITYFTLAGFLLFSMVYNLSIIFRNTNSTNLYQRKIKKWAIFLILILISISTFIVVGALLYLKKINSDVIDSRVAFIICRFIIILFILFRPKFLDESGFTLKLDFINPGIHKLTITNFEFLFYGNQYFLNTEANLDDFALKLNHTKEEVNEFIKRQFECSFNELLNKNRIYYFRELLKEKQHESFTIEALSEMSGFNNRQSMYNAFKKYEGCSPSEYIANL